MSWCMCVCVRGVKEDLGAGLFFYIPYSIFYILCTTLRVTRIERVEIELLRMNEGVDPELLKVDGRVE